MSADSTGTNAEHWEKQASNWITWAREPNFDAYWRYRSSFLDLVPKAGAATLEVGCGEGRIARDLAAHGHSITGIDASATLLDAAREAHRDGEYVLADAAKLPFPDSAFSLVVAYNSLMDMDDMPSTVREMARVLQPGGRLFISITHPFMDSGYFNDDSDDAALVIEKSVLDTWPFHADAEKDGKRMNFRGWHYPLEAYSMALEKAGLLIESMREPKQDDQQQSRWQRIPMFLWLTAIRPSGNS